jgi:ubiquinone/menaquinone biosynthesis C-methylase UbiE
MDVVERPASTNGYVIDAESGAEVARLIEQDRFLNTSMGGPVPERDDLTSMHTILDLACGPGSWALEMAYCYPRLQVTGVDVSQGMIDFARMRARTQELDNAHFQVMDITQPLDVDDEAFDLVNGRLLVGVLSREAWLPLLRECTRVLRPGGILRLTECELSVTTSPALEELTGLASQALWRGGYSFSPDGRQLCVTPVLGRLLYQAGCEHIEQQLFVIDYSVDGDDQAHWVMYRYANVSWLLLAPFLYKMDVITADRYEKLYQQMCCEMLEGDFCGLWYFCTTWGHKPCKGL